MVSRFVRQTKVALQVIAVLVYGLVIPSAATAQNATPATRAISPGVQQPILFKWDDNSGNLPGYDSGNVLLIGAAVVAVVVVVYLVTKRDKSAVTMRASTPMVPRAGMGFQAYRTAPSGAPTSREASTPFRAVARPMRPFVGVAHRAIAGAGASVVLGLSVPMR